MQLVHWITSSVQENYKFTTCCVHQIVFCFCFDIQNNFMYTICTELVVFLYWTCNSTNYQSSHFGLIDVRISASDKDLPVHISFVMALLRFETAWNIFYHFKNWKPHKWASNYFATNSCNENFFPLKLRTNFKVIQPEWQFWRKNPM